MKRLNPGLLSLLTVLAAVPCLCAADAPRPPSAADARELVRQLASEDFAAREEAARRLFVEMCLSDAGLLIEAEKDPAAGAAALVARCQQQQQRMRFGIQPLPLGQVAVLLYVAGDERVTLDLSNLYVLCNVLYHQEV